MKKIMIAVAVVFTAGIMASCNGEGCYKLSVKSNVLGVESEAVTYVYGDSDDIDAAEAQAKKAAEALGGEVKVSRVKVNKSEQDCADAAADRSQATVK